jgi:hypothetical protein
MNYIDADKLIAEIERRIARLDKELKPAAEEDFVSSWASTANNKRVALQSILSFIASLQQEQPEVEFEKAYKSYMKSRKDDLSGNAVTVNMKDLARHFYELGLNARENE